MASKPTTSKIYAMIDRERRLHGIVLALRWVAAAAVIALAVRMILYWLRCPVPNFSWYAAGLSLLLFVIIFLCGRKSLVTTAAELDTLAPSGNRLETAAILRNGNHPLREAQQAETEAYFLAHRPPRRLYRRLLPLLLLLTALWLPLALIPDRSAATVKPTDQAKKASVAENKPEAKAKEAEETAELSFVAPESEIRAKPMDEIAFEGQAVSSSGFREITLHIAVNAKPKKTVKITDVNLDRPGKTVFGGEFFLDELEVKPFDLVTYHLSGYSANDREKRRPVVSLPQFIEVRPFREDAFVENMPGGGNTTEMIVKFLNAQIALNKSAFIARSAIGKVDNQALLKEIRALDQAQEELGLEVAEYINSIDPRTIPANAYYSLKQAMDKMRLARMQLQLATKNLQHRPPPEPEVKIP